MIGLFILIFFFIAIIMYLIILGSSMNKTNKEKELELKEQAKYLQNYERKKLNKKKARLGKKK